MTIQGALGYCLWCDITALTFPGCAVQLQEPQADDLRPAQVQVAQALTLPQLAEAGCAQAFAALQAQPLQVLDPCSASDRYRHHSVLGCTAGLTTTGFGAQLSSREEVRIAQCAALEGLCVNY